MNFKLIPLAYSRLLGLVLIGLVLILGSMIANSLGLLVVSFEIQSRCQNPRDKLLFGRISNKTQKFEVWFDLLEISPWFVIEYDVIEGLRNCSIT